MEFEFDGRVYRLEDLKGGHNGRVAAACASSPPAWDARLGRWVVHVTNNIIDIDLGEHPAAWRVPPPREEFRAIRISGSLRQRYRSTGILVTDARRQEEQPRFPVQSAFFMHVRVTLPGMGTAINTEPFRMVATNVMEWPPPVGTVYENLDDVELYPEWLPFGSRVRGSVARIRKGDTAIISDVFPKPEGRDPTTTVQRLLNWLTQVFVTDCWLTRLAADGPPRSTERAAAEAWPLCGQERLQQC